jgi:phosphate-selective porin OprO/OprP
MHLSVGKFLCRVAAGGVAALLLAAGVARASDPELEAIKARMELLEKQNSDLVKQLQVSTQAAGDKAADKDGALSRDDVKKLIDEKLKDVKAKDDKKKEDKAQEDKAKADDFVKVGSKLKASASWNEGGYLWIKSEDESFTMHPGFWMHYDNVFWRESNALRTAPDGRPTAKFQGAATGVSSGGIGDLEDGTFFRRIRPFIEGTFWETFEYRLILALENNQFSSSGLDEFWVGENFIPIVGTVRVGHVKTTMGFEADMTASSRTMTFMERSSYSDAIEENQNFMTGVWQCQNFFDQHATISSSFGRWDNGASSGAFFGDGQYAAGCRLTALPIYACDGRHWLHLGVAANWRNGANNLTAGPNRLFQLRARPELRDDTPAGQGGTPAAAVAGGAQTVPNANSNRLVDTGTIAAHDQYILGLEMCYVMGPFSIQGEYGWNWVDRAFAVAASGANTIVPSRDYVFDGGYIQVAYTITGEARAYDRKYGTLARDYFGPKGPYENAWFVKDENGHCCWGLGAWEIAARYSYVNLNSGPAPARIEGGDMNGVTVGLNWYLNNNLKFQFDWVYDYRYALPNNGGGLVFPNGWTQGFGARMALSF